MVVGHDDVHDSYHDSETFPQTPFQKSFLIFFLPDIGDYGGYLTSKGFYYYFSTIFLGFGF